MAKIDEEVLEYLKSTGRWRTATQIAEGIASSRRELARKQGSWVGKIGYGTLWWYLFLFPWSGNLYPALFQLERAGKIQSKWEQETSLFVALNGGHRRRLYHT